VKPRLYCSEGEEQKKRDPQTQLACQWFSFCEAD
jgi:hypothetical protein